MSAEHEHATQATAAARAATGADLEVRWDGEWIVRVGDVLFPAPDLFHRGDPDWKKWAARPAKHLRDAGDYWFHVYKPQHGDVIVDIGAGRGEDVFAFARAVEPGGRVWALEPHPVSFAALRELCSRNGLLNVELVNVACVDRPGALQIETL